jgi:hypothetical protein
MGLEVACGEESISGLEGFKALGQMLFLGA